MKNKNAKQTLNLNAELTCKDVKHNGRNYTNLVLRVQLQNGKLVEFEIKEKFFNRKFDYMLKQNIKHEKESL